MKCNPGQKYLEQSLKQIKEIKQNRTGVENFGNSFLVVFVCSYKSFVSVERLCTRFSLHVILPFS